MPPIGSPPPLPALGPHRSQPQAVPNSSNPAGPLSYESPLVQKKPCHVLVAVDPRQWRQVGGKPLSSRNLFFWPRRSLLQLAFQPYSPPALIHQPLTCCWWNRISFAGAGVNSWSSGADKSCSCHGKRQKIRERRPILNPSRPHPRTL